MPAFISKMIWADLVVAIHFGFILFVVFGGLLVLQYPKMIWLHLPAAIWGVLIELTGWSCPLTSLEYRLRSGGGGEYAGSFIERYLIPIIYPAELTRELQMALGIGVILINLGMYKMIITKYRGRR